MNRILFSIIGCSLTCSCMTKHSEMSSLAASERCEEALDAMTQVNSQESTNQSVKQVGGTVASYTTTVMGYSADVLLGIAGGVVIGVTICSPALAIDVASGGSSNLTGSCIGGVAQELPAPQTGKKTYEATQEWRQKDLSKISANLRSIASCYERRNRGDDMRKSLKQLETVTENEEFWQSISEDEQKMVLKQHRQVSEKLHMAWVSPIEKREEQKLRRDTIPVNAWTEPANKTLWRLCAKNATVSRAELICARCSFERMQLPTLTDLASGYANGLHLGSKNDAFGGDLQNQKIWVSGQLAADGKGELFDTETGTSSTALDALSVGHVLCVVKPGN